jgi:flagellar biogenesis protein FliO
MKRHSINSVFPRVAVLLGLALITSVLGTTTDPKAAPESDGPDSIGTTGVPTTVAPPDTPSQIASWPDRERLARDSSWPPSTSGSAWMWRYLLSLIVVGGLMLGAFLALRRMRGMLGNNTSANQLRILGRLGLDRQNTVFLLKANDEVLTIASGPHGVRVLARKAADETADDRMEDARTGFGSILQDKIQQECSE